MTRAMVGVGAGVGLALLLVGCANSNFAGLFSTESDLPTGNDVVAGKLEVVATSTQTKLARVGYTVVLTHEGDAIHLTSATKTGATFTLVLTREQTAQGEQTRIKLKWGNGYDREAGMQVLAEATGKTGH